MLLETSLVPPAACEMLRAISRVAAPCSSTAAAIAVVTSLISPIVLLMLRIAVTADVAKARADAHPFPIPYTRNYLSNGLPGIELFQPLE